MESYFRKNPEKASYTIVDSEFKLYCLAQKMKTLEEFAFDTETNTLRVYGPNKDFRLVGVSISWGGSNNYYIPTGHRRLEDLYRNVPLDLIREYLKPVFEREDVRIVCWNGKFDFHVLARIGILVKTTDIFDGMLASWLCNENTPNGLKDNSREKLRISQTHFNEVMNTVTKEIKKEFGLKAANKATFDLVLIDDGAPYALDDAFYTWELYLGYMDEVEREEMDKVLFKHMFPFLTTLFNMEEHGVTIDTEYLTDISNSIKEDLENLKYQMFEIVGIEFNPNSSAQLAELLFGFQKPLPELHTVSEYVRADDKKRAKMKKDYDAKVKVQEESKLLAKSYKLKVISKTAGGAPQTNAEVLWKISKLEFKDKKKREGVELCKVLMKYKKLEKLNTAFIDGMFNNLYDDGKIHCSFNQIGTDSGRLSCSAVNLQQLPKAGEEDKYQIRRSLIGSIDPVTGKRKKIIASDFSNLEIRVQAHFSEDPVLLEMFAKGDDVHGSTAVNMFELDCEPNECKKKYKHLRQVGKILNFLLSYGGGAYTLYLKLKEDHEAPIDLGAKEYLEQYAEYGVQKGEDVAQVYIDKYFDTYKGVAQFIKNQKRYAHKHGFVYTILKRKRRLPDINNRDDFKQVAFCERLAVNAAIQGTAADITSAAQNRVDKDPWFEEHRCLMIIQIHDELVFECPEEFVEEAIGKIEWYMSHPFGDNVKLNLDFTSESDSSDSYADAK